VKITLGPTPGGFSSIGVPKWIGMTVGNDTPADENTAVLSRQPTDYGPEFRSTFIHYTKAISISSMVRNIFSCFLVSATRRETLKFFFSSRMYTL